MSTQLAPRSPHGATHRQRHIEQDMGRAGVHGVVDAIRHAHTCTHEHCTFEHCRAVKYGLTHLKEAVSEDCGADCDICAGFIARFGAHAEECRAADCSVPYCSVVKQRLTHLGSLRAPSSSLQQELTENYHRNCCLAAEAINEADILLVATGAGFSADSGLAVYKDIADYNAYKALGLTYSDLCTEEWLVRDPSLFYGFWGACMNDYHRVPPHRGYEILHRWRDERFDHTKGAIMVRQEVSRLLGESQRKRQALQATGPMLPSTSAPNLLSTSTPLPATKFRHVGSLPPIGPTEGLPGGFFVLTSNVDSHFRKAGFPEGEIYEIHGNADTWQCAAPCGDQQWTLPEALEVDPHTMRVETNHPRCPKCGGPARPSVLMFNDHKWIEAEQPPSNYLRWEDAVLHLCEIKGLRLVVLECGAGVRVPSIRTISEEYVKRVPRGRCTLVRINPDHPLAPTTIADSAVSIMGPALATLETIDEALAYLRPPSRPRPRPRANPVEGEFYSTNGY